VVLFNFKTELFGANMNLFARFVKRKNNLLFGVGNRCRNGMYVLFLDYDDVPLTWVREEIHLLQSRFDSLIGSAYIFGTRKGFHVVFLEKNDLEDVIEMMKVTSCDKHYKDIPMYYGRRIWVLRQSPKKNEDLHYVGCMHKITNSNLCSFVTINERSFSHKNYLQQMFVIPEKDFVKGNKFDKEVSITLAHYKVGDDNA